MSQDIVKVLKSAIYSIPASIGREAADIIEALRRERDILQRAVNTDYEQLYRETLAYSAQLRDALNAIQQLACYPEDVLCIARDALDLPSDDTALKQAMENELLNPWKRAIIDATVVGWSYSKEHDNNPTAAINALLCISNQYALDPQISEDADKLCRQYGAKLLRQLSGKVDVCSCETLLQTADELDQRRSDRTSL